MKSAYKDVENYEEHRFEKFYERHKQLVYNIAMEKLNDKELAFRVVEETFLRAFLHREQIHNPGSFKAQAYVIANMRSVLEEVYKEAREKMGIPEPEENDEDPFWGNEGFDVDQVLARNDMVADLARYTDKLTCKEKELVFLLFFMECSKKDIARRFDIPAENVRLRVFKVKRKLAKLMLEKEGDL